MTQPIPKLTQEDFISTSWEDVVNGSNHKVCCTYSPAFSVKAREAKDEGNTTAQTIFDILEFITTAEIRSEAPEEAFSQMFENLTDWQLDFLAEIITEVNDSELKARIADILWIRRRVYQMAQLAIVEYLNSATILEDPHDWMFCVARIERSLSLSYQVNYKKEKVLAHIETVLDRYQGEDRLWLSSRLMESLLDRSFGDPGKYAALSEKAARSAELLTQVVESPTDASLHWMRARHLWFLKALWHRMAKSHEEERNASMLSAETYVKEATAFVQANPPDYIRAASLLQQAVCAFRGIRGTAEETRAAKARAEEIHLTLLDYQQESLNYMVSSSHSVDVGELIDDARNRVRGKKFEDALFALAMLGRSANVAHLRQQAHQYARDFIASSLMPKVLMNEMGKVVARQPGSALSQDPAEAESAIIFSMYQNAIIGQTLHAQAYIQPARHQINLEHSLRIKDIFRILVNSPFVPPGREWLFSKGIYAGLTGDLYTSTHLLIPQVENSVRYIMHQHNILTSGLDDNGIQHEHNLNSTLYHPNISSIFDEDTLFDLRGLLVEHAGSNVRNLMAHGLMSDGDFVGSITLYIWWLVLRLCLLPLLNQQNEQEVDVNQ